jgi:ribosomal protein S6--L-glutamate ligase
MSMGIGVLRVESDQQLATALDIVAQTGSGYVVQPLLMHDGDMRVYVADGDVVSSLTRRPRPNGYLASISQGGSLEVTDDHREVADHCRRIARSLSAEWMCVDWLMTESGPVLNEWSTAHGGFTLLPEPERTLVADAFFGWIKRRLTESAPIGRTSHQCD